MDDDGYAALDDAGVIEAARQVYRQLQYTPRWDNNNDALIKSWGVLCREMGKRGITDTVTEGERPGERFARLMGS